MDWEPIISKNLFGGEEVNVFCIECKRNFMASTDYIDPYDDLIQLYPRCPVCLKRTKVKVIKN